MTQPGTSTQTRDVKLSPSARSAFIGAIIVTVFALVWGNVGSSALDGAIGNVARALVLIVTFVYLGGTYRQQRLARRNGSPSEGTTGVNAFRSWQYAVIVVAEVVVLVLIIRLLVVTGHRDAVVSGIAVIVGLHLIALQPVLRAKRLIGTGAAMTIIALAALALPTATSSGNLRQAVVGLGSALCLWWGIFPLVTRGTSSTGPSDASSSGIDLH